MPNDTFEVKENIKEQLKSVPQLPGVYVMKDATGEIIYVGKSKFLKNRLSSYFRGFSKHLPKTQTMVVNIASFEYIITDSEMEALILEANLIKKHLPRFNILLKDDKNYPYIVITLGEDFPRVFMTRNYQKGAYKYFGPYTGAEQVRITLEVIQTIFPIRECSRKITEKVDRPCLNYYIGRCAGVCNHMITKEAYGEYIQAIIRFLNGDKEWLLKDLQEKMTKAASELKYEDAAAYRDQIVALKALNEKQKALQTNDKNQDYVAYYSYEEKTCVMLFQVRNGKIVGRESFNVANADHVAASDLLSSFITQYYLGSNDIPREIYLSDAMDGMELYSTWLSKLSGHKVIISVPLKGEKKKTIELVEKNAKEYIMKFQTRIEKELSFRNKAENELRTMLELPDNIPLKRLEAYDISNTSGVHSVGSMVVYDGGVKKRSDYRRYRVKTIEGSNDYGSMQEVLYRRFKRGLEEQKMADETGKSFSIFPDLILIDGGKGHVNAVNEILNALEIHIPIAGMVKDDYHKTDDLYFNGTLRKLKEHNSAFRLISEIQDEVHRFAIEYHKSLRSKEMVHSILDEIEGIGEKRRIALMKHFKSIEAIQKASLDELLSVQGLNRKVAQKIYEFFK
ncbi:MAG: excinuclease ABC subunit UvrC [Clostridia bacterium]|nr:excinuclease ABC subunit UvrC [Clostridia bacterium]